MKLLAIAFGIVCVVAVVCYGLVIALVSLSPSLQAAALAVTVVGTVVSSLPKVAELLERQESIKRLAGGGRKAVYDFRGFQIAWPLMVVYGTVALSLVGQAGAGIAGIGLAATGVPSEGANAAMFAKAAGFFGTVATILGAYLVGRWIGARTARRGIVAILLIAPLTAAAAVGTDMLLLPDEVYSGMQRSGSLMEIAKISFIVIVFGLIGYWRGHRRRLSKYLDYLLSVLPAQTRETVVELAYEESQKVAAAAGNVDVSNRT
jgi:hypothetical protein